MRLAGLRVGRRGHTSSQSAFSPCTRSQHAPSPPARQAAATAIVCATHRRLTVLRIDARSTPLPSSPPQPPTETLAAVNNGHCRLCHACTVCPLCASSYLPRCSHRGACTFVPPPPPRQWAAAAKNVSAMRRALPCISDVACLGVAPMILPPPPPRERPNDYAKAGAAAIVHLALLRTRRIPHACAAAPRSRVVCSVGDGAKQVPHRCRANEKGACASGASSFPLLFPFSSRHALFLLCFSPSVERRGFGLRTSSSEGDVHGLRSLWLSRSRAVREVRAVSAHFLSPHVRIPGSKSDAERLLNLPIPRSLLRRYSQSPHLTASPSSGLVTNNVSGIPIIAITIAHLHLRSAFSVGANVFVATAAVSTAIAGKVDTLGVFTRLILPSFCGFHCVWDRARPGTGCVHVHAAAIASSLADRGGDVSACVQHKRHEQQQRAAFTSREASVPGPRSCALAARPSSSLQQPGCVCKGLGILRTRKFRTEDAAGAPSDVRQPLAYGWADVRACEVLQEMDVRREWAREVEVEVEVDAREMGTRTPGIVRARAWARDA
ncbi:hypothetical protein DFH06DRAFT_1341541 [Mycena polygramma]|nr:hypothetical protein DFH06DRAFT_1341541 [Mycena polygramma]